MGEDAIRILYPDNLNFAKKYDANCYKDLDKDTKQYLNSQWEKFKTGVLIEGEDGDQNDTVIIEIITATVIVTVIITVIAITRIIKKRKRKI